MKEIEIDAGENMFLKNKNDKQTNKVLIKKLVGDMRSMIEDNFFEGLLVEEKLKDRYLQNEPTIVQKIFQTDLDPKKKQETK